MKTDEKELRDAIRWLIENKDTKSPPAGGWRWALKKKYLKTLSPYILAWMRGRKAEEEKKQIDLYDNRLVMSMLQLYAEEIEREAGAKFLNHNQERKASIDARDREIIAQFEIYMSEGAHKNTAYLLIKRKMQIGISPDRIKKIIQKKKG